jgi:hypothetical protein
LPASSATGSNGIAILTLNASDITGGEYLIMVEVNRSTELQENYVTTSDDYDNPRVELRSFSLAI